MRGRTGGGPEPPGGPGPQLAAVRYQGDGAPAAYPFHVPAIATLASVEFTSPVTLLAGENGSGKSTFLEALAVAAELPAVGAQDAFRDPSLAPARALARRLRLTWRGRTRRGFFLRAEDFFGFQRRVQQARAEHAAELERIDREMADASPYARGLAAGPHRASLAEMSERYGEDPDAASHGEAFLRLFRSRLTPGGLFLLDEPEAALSPQSQLGFMAMMRDAVEAGGQFIIATHAPILLATPGATILGFDDPPVRPVRFESLDAVTLVREFLLEPQRYLRHLWPT